MLEYGVCGWTARCYTFKVRKAAERFAKYLAVGVSTFLLDLCLLYVLIDIFSVPTVYAAGVAFLVAVTVNYVISRKFVFVGTLRGVKAGYVNFLLIVLIGLAVVMGGMYVLTTMFGLGYLLSRALLAAMTGVWNYLMNLFVNFKVAGKH